MKKSQIVSNHVANRWNGEEWVPAIYPVVLDHYVPSENPTYPYLNEVWLYNFSSSNWTLVHQRRHNHRIIIPSSGSRRAMYIEYWYTPSCGYSHNKIGYASYWHCLSSDGSNGNCNWARPSSSNAYIQKDSPLPSSITYDVVNQYYSWWVQKTL